MLDVLIESKKSAGEKKRLGVFLMTTFSAVTSALMIGLVYSLFGQSLAMGNDNLNISALTAPVTIAEQVPPPIAKEIKQTVQKNSSACVPVRRENLQRTEEFPNKPPNSVSTFKNTVAARPDGSSFILGNRDDVDPSYSGSIADGRGGYDNKQGLSNSNNTQKPAGKVEIEKPPVIKQQPKPEPKPTDRPPVSTGVVNGKAVNLVKPIYPASARLVQARGEVKVQVTIDEEGNVIAANVVSGHPLLKASALSAAKASKFSPTFLSKEKVKVTGFILYNFNL